MKTKLTSLLVVLLLTTTQCMAQKRITVEAQSNDISNNLDLQAVASTFGESSDLQDFERRLNDYDSAISNLDLNNDGEVDYLRVIETYEKNAHIIVIQAVLGQDVFQDVATIVVDKNQNSRSYVQVIGDPYLFGYNYIIDPVYVYTPSIFNYLWGMHYRSWYSPYYWGYYPNYYRHRNPWDVNRYYSHIQSHINHNYRYYYSNRIRNNHVESVIHRIGRNDYATRHPERTFTSRNENYRNKNEFNTRSSLPSHPENRNNESVRRNTSPTWTGGETPRTINSGRDQNRQNSSNNAPIRNNNSWQNSNSNRNQPANSTPAPSVNRNNESRNNDSKNNNTYQQRNQNNTPARTEQRTITRENNNSRPTPSVNQPTRTAEPKQVERKSPETNRSSSKQENRSSRNESNRR